MRAPQRRHTVSMTFVCIGYVLIASCFACRRGDDAPATPVPSVEVVLETNKGNIVVKLAGDKAPLSTTNFLRYVDEGFYDGTVFHRVIYDFMIQGGGMTPDLKEKPTHDAVRNEARNGLRNARGTLAMARTRDIDSATAQFFINVEDNERLNHSGSESAAFGYAVFGQVTEGMEVVEAIRNVATLCPSDAGVACDAPLPSGMRDVPEEAVIIKKARRR